MKSIVLKLLAAAGIAMMGGPAAAQDADSGWAAPAVEENGGSWDAPAAEPGFEDQAAESYEAAPAAEAPGGEWTPVSPDSEAVDDGGEVAATAAGKSSADGDAGSRASASIRNEGVARDDIFTAAEGVFGRGAEGLADLIEDILRDQGEPTAYITGQEAGGAFVVGLRYGSGTLHHQIEGDRRIYWTGPSLGFDFGAGASKVFVLVYNLHDSQTIFKRFPAAEGHAYVVGGFTASYMRRGDVVLIPIRMGVGMRLGVNAGYMRFTERTRWLPF